MLIRCGQLSFDSKSQFHCKQLNFGSESQIRCKTHILAANANSLQTSQFQQRITISLQDTMRQRMLIRCRKLNFGSESQIHCQTHISAVNANPL
jgi:hypothetical protein